MCQTPLHWVGLVLLLVIVAWQIRPRFYCEKRLPRVGISKAMSESKPRIYISSTIYDFHDLRSALKYWLEGLGYEVMLSEFNDFTKRLEENSYDACLQAIDDAQYFLLLVGARVGGLYDFTQGLSITRMEYRRAYELLKSGRMKLITFVREELWNVREDRKALEALLVNDHKLRKELDDTQIQSIVEHKSTFVNDGKAVFEFLNEITRNEEMKLAIAGRGPFPRANWVHRFSEFADILNALRTEFNITEDLGRIALKMNLKRELLTNLVMLTMKSERLTDGKIRPITMYASAARSHFKGGLDESSIMPAKWFRTMVYFYLLISRKTEKLSTRFIDQAINSGAFLEYHPTSDEYRSGLINDRLIDLIQNIDRLKDHIRQFDQEKMGFLKKYERQINSEEEIIISNWDLISPFAMYDLHQNVLELCVALVRALAGDSTALSALRVRPTSPMEDEAAAMEKEVISIEDMERWIWKD